jgi:hypothetical protein
MFDNLLRFNIGDCDGCGHSYRDLVPGCPVRSPFPSKLSGGATIGTSVHSGASGLGSIGFPKKGSAGQLENLGGGRNF